MDAEVDFSFVRHRDVEQYLSTIFAPADAIVEEIAANEEELLSEHAIFQRDLRQLTVNEMAGTDRLPVPEPPFGNLVWSGLEKFANIFANTPIVHPGNLVSATRDVASVVGSIYSSTQSYTEDTSEHDSKTSEEHFRKKLSNVSARGILLVCVMIH